MQRCLVEVLASSAEAGRRSEISRFLKGLSVDELQFIAGFLGACVLEAGRFSLGQVAERLAGLQPSQLPTPRSSEDWDHKMILLFEYLCRRQASQFSAARAGHAERAPSSRDGARRLSF